MDCKPEAVGQESFNELYTQTESHIFICGWDAALINYKATYYKIKIHSLGELINLYLQLELRLWVDTGVKSWLGRSNARVEI